MVKYIEHLLDIKVVLRIDYILASRCLEPHLASCDIQPEVLGSDHCPVAAEFKLHIRDRNNTNSHTASSATSCFFTVHFLFELRRAGSIY
jgi:hypothetical protein